MVSVVATMPCHELGHAVAFWLTGSPAIPALFLTVTIAERSWFWILLVSSLLLAASLFAKKRGRDSLLYLTALTLGIQLYFSVIASSSVQEQICAAAGLIGEALIAPVCILLATQNLGKWWHQYRTPVALLASVSLGHSVVEWIYIQAGKHPLPIGSLLFGADHGDLNKLIGEYGWSEPGLISLFTASNVVAVGLVIAFWAVTSKLREVESKG